MNNKTKMVSYYIYNFPIYTNLTEITTDYIDIGNTFILPFISVIGIITSLICVIVLKNINSGVNQYFYLASISDLIFSLINISIGFIRCGSFCSFGYSYVAKIVELYIYNICNNSCLLFSLLIDLAVTIKKLRAFSVKHRLTSKIFVIKQNKTKISIVISISLSVNIIIFALTREVDQFGYYSTNSTLTEMYKIISNNIIKKNYWIEIIVYILTLLRGLFFIIVLFILNFIVLVKYKRYLNKKRTTSIQTGMFN